MDAAPPAVNPLRTTCQDAPSPEAFGVRGGWTVLGETAPSCGYGPARPFQSHRLPVYPVCPALAHPGRPSRPPLPCLIWVASGPGVPARRPPSPHFPHFCLTDPRSPGLPGTAWIVLGLGTQYPSALPRPLAQALPHPLSATVRPPGARHNVSRRRSAGFLRAPPPAIVTVALPCEGDGSGCPGQASRSSIPLCDKQTTTGARW